MEFVAINIPGVQNPHCGPDNSANDTKLLEITLPACILLCWLFGPSSMLEIR